MKKPIKVHFIGIGGSGASAAAAISYSQGYEVTGCDLKIDSQYLTNFPREIKVVAGHDPVHLNGVDIVVASPAISKLDPDNYELKKAKELSLPLFTWQEFMGKYLQKGKYVIAIAGTHGKSTTTAMIGHILEKADFSPTVEIGAVDLEWGTNFKIGHGKFFICEADEYYHNFLNYYPNFAVVTNIEFDHPDFYRNENKLFDAFFKFICNLKPPAYLVVDKEANGIKKLVEHKINKITTIYSRYRSFKLQVIGTHNLRNACLAATLAESLNIDLNTITSALEEFKGVAQRLEKKGNFLGCDIYSDYAVHPTEVETVLKSLKEIYRDRKIIAVFEPHTFSRLKFFFSDFVKVFTQSNVDVIITDVFGARERVGEITATDLANNIANSNYVPYNEVVNYLRNKILEVGKKVVLVVMGAGNAYKIANELVMFKS